MARKQLHTHGPEDQEHPEYRRCDCCDHLASEVIRGLRLSCQYPGVISAPEANTLAFETMT